MAVTVRSSNSASNVTGNLAVTKPAGLTVGDLMIGWHVADNDAVLASMGGPSGFTLLGSDAGVAGGDPYVKVWTKVADSSDVAASTFTFTNSTSGIFNSAAVVAITTGTYDTTSPTGSVSFQSGTTNTTSHVAPSVSGIANGLLITSLGTDSGGTAATYTPPSGMTELVDTNSGAGSYTTLEIATLDLTSGAATGTKTGTCTVSRPFNGSALVVNPPGAGSGGMFRSVSSASVLTGDAIVSKPSGLTLNDLMVAWHYTDNDSSLAAMGAPTGWNLLGSSAGAAAGHPYVKVWTRVATSGDVAGSTFTFTNSTASISGSAVIFAITAGTYDTGTPTGAVSFQSSSSNATSHTAPSVTGVVGGLLCTSHGTDTNGVVATYTPPSGMTEQADTNSGTGSYVSLEANTLDLAAAGATGTQSATCTVSRPWQCSALVVNPVPTGGGSGVSFVAATSDSRGTTTATTVAVPAGITAGDLLLAFQVSDTRGTLAAMTAPAGWTLLDSNTTRSADVGFIKIWTKTATGSESAYTFNDSTSATADACVVALTGWDSTDPYAAVPTWNSGTAQTTHVAPSVNGVNTGMLLTVHIAGTAGTTRQYTSGPSGMTLAQAVFLSSAGWLTENVYYLALTATGATGSKIATLAASAPFVAVSLVVQPPLPKSVLPSSIATGEAFGSPFIAGDQTVSPDGIATAEAFGSPTLTVDPAPQTVSPSGIATAEAIGSPTVTVDLAPQTVIAVGLASEEAFGSPVVTVDSGLQTVVAIGLASEEAFGIGVISGLADLGTLYPGIPRAYPGADVYPGASGFGPYPDVLLYPTATTYPGVPVIDPQPQEVAPTGVVSAEAFGGSVVTVTGGDQGVQCTAIDTAEAFGAATVTVDAPAFTISPDGISSAEAFGDPARAYVFLEVSPPVPTGNDTYFVEGTDLTGFAWRITTAEGLQDTPGVIGEDVVLPGRDGAVEVFGGFGQQRRADAIGKITFSMWLKGVSASDGLIPGGSTTQAQYFARWDELVKIFHRRRVTIDHVYADGTTRRATGHLMPGESITPSRDPSSPWFGRFKATFAIPAAHWLDTSTVTTGQVSLTTGGALSLSAFSGATAACTELDVVFGAGSNPRLSTAWGHVGWNNVISAGRQLGIHTVDGTTNSAAGTAWTPGYDALTFAPGPRLFEVDPSEALTATLTHTGGGSMTVQVTGKRRYRTS